jgi:hypothetical protein
MVKRLVRQHAGRTLNMSQVTIIVSQYVGMIMRKFVDPDLRRIVIPNPEMNRVSTVRYVHKELRAPDIQMVNRVANSVAHLILQVGATMTRRNADRLPRMIVVLMRLNVQKHLMEIIYVARLKHTAVVIMAIKQCVVIKKPRIVVSGAIKTIQLLFLVVRQRRRATQTLAVV